MDKKTKLIERTVDDISDDVQMALMAVQSGAELEAKVLKDLKARKLVSSQKIVRPFLCLLGVFALFVCVCLCVYVGIDVIGWRFAALL